MINYSLYGDRKEIPLGDRKIRLCRIRNRDERHIRIYRKQSAEGEMMLCMVSGIQNDPVSYRMAVTRWLREYARVEFEKKARMYAEKMQVSFGRIAVKEQKTRWASCSSKGNLNFNWKLILMPEKIQDYVVVHELAHRRQMNHSKAFWKEVECILPDYMECKTWLKEHEMDFLEY